MWYLNCPFSNIYLLLLTNFQEPYSWIDLPKIDFISKLPICFIYNRYKYKKYDDVNGVAISMKPLIIDFQWCNTAINHKLIPQIDFWISLAEALSPAIFHGAADLWSHPLAYGATAEQQLQLHQQALLHPALQQQLPVRSFL